MQQTAAFRGDYNPWVHCFGGLGELPLDAVHRVGRQFFQLHRVLEDVVQDGALPLDRVGAGLHAVQAEREGGPRDVGGRHGPLVFGQENVLA
ncbi:hypothetical protein [Nonomuraea sp. NPDC049607]|uniref:hypothetical protein n=1 Tax=Nonomuraea sp. NPDC049607 TaxID=3154732 RepID=UPI003431DD34